jgi:hypothetical protein
MIAAETLRDDKFARLNDFLENDAAAGRSDYAPIQTRFGWRNRAASFFPVATMN